MTSLYDLPDNLKKSKDFDFHVIHGKVIKSEMWTETNVSGGGAQIHTGPVSHQKKISTKTTNLRRIWVLKPDGRQSEFVVDADRMPISDDHLLTITVASRNDKEVPVSIINHTLDKTFTALGKDIDTIYSRPLLQLAVVLSTILFIFGIPALFGAPLIGIFMILPSILTMRRAVKLGKALLAQIEPVTEAVKTHASYENIKSIMEEAA